MEEDYSDEYVRPEDSEEYDDSDYDSDYDDSYEATGATHFPSHYGALVPK